MFRQCLQDDVDQVAQDDVKLDESVATVCEPGLEAIRPALLAPGTQVIIQGLTKIPAFNGQSGIVERLDEATGRYSVKLTTGGPGIPKFAKVKADNLCVLAISSSLP